MHTNSKLPNSKTEQAGNRNLNNLNELKTAGLSLFPMDWLNNNSNVLPVWSSANNLSTNSNLAINLPNNLDNNYNLTNQSANNQLDGFTASTANELANLTSNSNIYSSLLSQNYLIPFLKNAALLANLTTNPLDLNSSSLNSTNSGGSEEKGTNKKSISSIDFKEKKENDQGKNGIISFYFLIILIHCYLWVDLFMIFIS